MIGALISGELATDPQQRTTRDGRPFWTATARVAAGPESLFVSLSTFSTSAGERLAKLRKGSPVSASGVLEQTSWTTQAGEERRGWRLTAGELLTVYEARKRREGDRREQGEPDDDSRSVARMWRDEREHQGGHG